MLSIISSVHTLRLHVIVKGMETAAQLQYLTHPDCDLMQGYYFSRPPPGTAFEQMRAEEEGSVGAPLHTLLAVYR